MKDNSLGHSDTSYRDKINLGENIKEYDASRAVSGHEEMLSNIISP